jgi:serine/threonine protein kinase
MAANLYIEVGTRIRSRSGIYYRVLQFLGAGGNSVVFLVLALNGQCYGVLFALKIFTRLSSTRRLEQFEQEIEFLRKCDHPSIMRVFDSGVYRHRGEGEVTSYPFVVVEYLPQSLHSLIRGATMATAERVSHTLQLLSALAYLDQSNPPVIHRDIKPKNIFVKGQSCVLGDFGLMKFLNEDDEIDRRIYEGEARTGMPFFHRTPDLVAYLREGTPLTTKTDIFQLGLVVAEVFTGRNPEIPAKCMTDPVDLDRLRFIPGALGMRIRELIENMLEPDPSHRPSAAELIDPWEGVFREVVSRCQELNGRVF